jgi:hypothetical protein
MKPKTWTPGAADEVWKQIVCARDYQRANDVVDWLIYILTDAGSDTKLGLASIREMSGDQIVNAIQAWRASNYESVRRGMGLRANHEADMHDQRSPDAS